MVVKKLGLLKLSRIFYFFMAENKLETGFMVSLLVLQFYLMSVLYELGKEM